METRLRKFGNFGEEVAKQFLEGKGFELLDRNYATRFGEIDLIFFDSKREEVVFVEVKTRQNQDHVLGEESINESKKRKLTTTAKIFLEAKELMDRFARFDVVIIELNAKKQEIRHLINVYG